MSTERERIRLLEAELEEYRELFALQYDRTQEAAARWRAEDPVARHNVMPDLGALLTWLMHQIDVLREERADLEKYPFHVVTFNGAGWVIMHPLTCRPRLFECPYNKAMSTTPPGDYVRGAMYRCHLIDDNTIRVGEPV